MCVHIQREREGGREGGREREKREKDLGSHSECGVHTLTSERDQQPTTLTNRPNFSGRRKFDFSFKEGLADDFAERVNGFREAAGPQYNR